MKSFLFLFAVAAAACGGSSSTAPDPALPADKLAPHAMHHDDEHAAMAALPAPIKQLHDVLAPRWHAAKGPQRMTDTCAAIPELRTHTTAVGQAPAPADVAAADWTARTTGLGTALTALEAPCKANDAAAFEPAFAAYHTAFHQVLEAAMGKAAHAAHEHADHADHADHAGSAAQP